MLSEYKGTECCNPRKAVTVTAANWAKGVFLFLTKHILSKFFIMLFYLLFIFFETESLYYAVLTT